MYRFRRFSYFASQVARTIAHPAAFLIVFILVVVWLLTGPLVGFNSLWRLVFSSTTTIITFLLLFLIQHTQAREMAAVQLKLNELVRAAEGTHNALLDIEQLTDRDYNQILESYSLLAKQAREQLKNGKLRWATARIQMESVEALLDPAHADLDSAMHAPVRGEDLRSSQIPDASLDAIFDRLTRVAARALDAPVVLISLVGDGRQWLASLEGLAAPYSSAGQTLLGQSFCRQVVSTRKPLIINDVRGHSVVKSSTAMSASGIGAYAGVPLMTADNQVLGSFCAIDHEPHNWTENDVSVLQDLSDIAMQEIHQNLTAHASRGGSVSSGMARDHATRGAFTSGMAGESATILIVDDSPTNQKLLSHRLEGEGYRVVLSATGQEALDYLKTNPIDLILLDIMLPGMDGEHVLQILQADRALKHIPVIMISALDEQESVRRCLQMGARDYLLKPFDPHQLHQCICMHLAARPISSTAVEAV